MSAKAAPGLNALALNALALNTLAAGALALGILTPGLANRAWAEPPNESPAGEVPAGEQLACEAAVARALNLGLGVAPALRRQAAARAALAEAWPALELRARSSYPDAVETFRAGLRLNLPTPGERGALADAARAEGAEAEAEARLAQLDVALAVRTAHLAVRIARARLAWAEADAAQGRARLEAIRRQTQAGLETAVLLAREALEADTRADEVILARALLAQSEADLAGLTGGAQAGEAPCAPPPTSPQGSPEESPGDAPAAPPPAEPAPRISPRIAPLALVAEHPALERGRFALTRATQQGEAQRHAGGLALNTVDIEWDQADASAGRVLLTVGLTLPSFGDEAAATSADQAVARAALTDAERQVAAETARLRAHVTAAERRVAALDARPPPPELAVLVEAQRQRPDAPETLALATELVRRDRRRAEARFALEAAQIALAHAQGR